jgi:hypothetical protein
LRWLEHSFIQTSSSPLIAMPSNLLATRAENKAYQEKSITISSEPCHMWRVKKLAEA